MAVLGGDLNDWLQANPSLLRHLLQWGGVAWLFVPPQSGELAAYDQVDIASTLETSSFLSGTHTAQIWIESNDPALPRLAVPLTLDVQGEAIAFVPTEKLTFGEGYIGYPRTRNLVVENRGAHDLHVLDIGADFEMVTISPTTFILPPLAQGQITVVYTATTVGTMEGSLTLTSNSAVSPTQAIAVHAISHFAPQIVLNPVDPALATTQIFTTANAQIAVGVPVVYMTSTATPTVTPTPAATATPTATSTPTATPTATLSAPLPASPAPTVAAEETDTPATLLGLVRTSGATLRQGPDIEAPIISTAPARTLLQIVGRVASGEWVEAKLPGGEATAWIAAGEIMVMGDIFSLPPITP
jgi:hypothetical protein